MSHSGPFSPSQVFWHHINTSHIFGRQSRHLVKMLGQLIRLALVIFVKATWIPSTYAFCHLPITPVIIQLSCWGLSPSFLFTHWTYWSRWGSSMSNFINCLSTDLMQQHCLKFSWQRFGLKHTRTKCSWLSKIHLNFPFPLCAKSWPP